MKPAVLLVGNFLSRTVGNRGVCEELAEQLAIRGWQVRCTSSWRGRAARLLDMVGTAWRERRRYCVAQVDVYSGPAFVWAEAVCQVLTVAGKPYILTLHGGNLPSFARRWPWRVRRLLRGAKVVTTPSRYLLEEMSIYRSDLRLLPNALDLARYPFRPRVNIAPRLIWLRAFSSIYNPALAPRVVAALAPEFPNIELIMVGPDKGDGSLATARRVAQELGVMERIEWPGAVPKTNVPHWINRGDIFLNTTNVDNTPVSVLEALACGLCVVSTNVGGIPYLLKHERNALLVPPDDVLAMSDAVRRLLSEPGLGQRLSRGGRETTEGYDWTSILPQWDEVLSAAVGARRS